VCLAQDFQKFFAGSWVHEQKPGSVLFSQDFCSLLDRSSLMFSARGSFIVGVRVGMTQFGHQGGFQCFHFFCLTLSS
jgi:hypothetical protein